MRRFLCVVILLLPVLAVAGSVPDSLADGSAAYSYFQEVNSEDEHFQIFTGIVRAPAYSATVQRMPLGLSSVRFRLRGYDSRYSDVSVGGVDLVNTDDGRIEWNLLTAARSAHFLEQRREGSHRVGDNIDINPFDPYRKTFSRVGYAASNRNYSSRIFASTYINIPDKKEKNNATMLSAGANLRFGQDGFVDGVFSDIATASIALRRDFRKNSLSLYTLFADGEQGLRSAATQEVYDLAGDNFYNSSWGYYGVGSDGEPRQRNTKIRSYGQTLLGAKYEYRHSPTLTFSVGLSALLSQSVYKNLLWYDAPTPYPDYYRYLPDFFGNTAVADVLRKGWSDRNPAVTQINWPTVVEANQLNTTPYGQRSHYAQAGNVTDRLNTSLFAEMRYVTDDNITFRLGAKLRTAETQNYMRMADLLGGSYWTDIDQYLIDDQYYSDKIQNDVRNPDRRIAKGDCFGYNYTLSSNFLKCYLGAAYSRDGWSFDALASITDLRFQREGLYEKEMFPENLSYGKSAKQSFRGYMVSGDIKRYFAANRVLGVNFTVGSVPPLADDIFVAPRYRNAVIEKPRTLSVKSAELFYDYSAPTVSLSAAAYISAFDGGSSVTNYYDDITSTYANLIMTDISKLHIGAELGAEINFTPKVALIATAAVGRYTYASDPSVKILSDSDGSTIVSGARSMLKGFSLSGTPQTAAVCELRLRLPWMITLSPSLRYFGNNYVSVNPVRRMPRALDLMSAPEDVSESLAQEMLGSAVTFNITASKNFRFRRGGYLGLWLVADNLLDNKDIRYAGYEQMRFSRTSRPSGSSLVPFASKYYYAYGTNFYFSVTYSF